MHVHISAVGAVVVTLEVLLLVGLLNWVAMKYSDRSKFWASYRNLYSMNN